MDLAKLEASLVYRASSRTARTTQRKKNKQRKEKKKRRQKERQTNRKEGKKEGRKRKEKKRKEIQDPLGFSKIPGKLVLPSENDMCLLQVVVM